MPKLDPLFEEMGQPYDIVEYDDEPATGTIKEAAATLPVLQLVSDDLAVLVNEATGEVEGVEGAPPVDTPDVRELVQWLAPRRITAEAKAAGLRAEKAFKQTKLDAEYDWQIKRADKTVKWLDDTYLLTLRDFAARALDGGRARSLKLAGLVLAFKTKPGKVEILDERAAQDYLTIVCPDAVETKTTTRVLVSKIPAELKGEFPPHSGLTMTPVSEVFEIK